MVKTMLLWFMEIKTQFIKTCKALGQLLDTRKEVLWIVLTGGIPVITPSNLNFAYPISSHDISCVENPKKMEDRQQLFND